MVIVVIVVMMVMTLLSAVDWMQDTIGGAMQTVAEGVVLAFVVVISHIRAVTGSFFECHSLTLSKVVCCWVLARVCALVLPPTRLSVLFGERCGAFAVISLGNVDASVDVYLSGRRVTSVVLAIVGTVLDVDLGVGVAAIRLTVAVEASVRLALVTCLA